ncbi:hypothetical protein PF002_g6164 [Phytophthora fragariae]|uniref:Uncharacterized protein n=2 Tax=Phytophthora fragariae TaxID=53985 RepID=A0A6A3UAS1_9STRA|nr:hypothetical protein PF011_g22860 [Phytophthora fragariae]KAE9107632.1 hypothetical protein PF007_g12965 [Phytophthora fragariae]KAE9147434.1 hypothetical protein PF006_g7874 [Phytophthora fragariae]KAE9239508.1 hypothetical protein PF004_g7908 [Phytophthora fragariae]KAE9247682.1 hypothetical protein PF002_g6164 [Phytophthora fragariae]
MKRILQGDDRIAMWLARDRVPRLQGFVTAGSRRYLEGQNLALQATTNAKVSEKYRRAEQPDLPAVERPIYPTPRAILRKPSQGNDQRLRSGERWLVLPVQVAADSPDPEAESDDAISTLQADDLESATGPGLDERVVEEVTYEWGSRGTTGGASTTSDDREEVGEPTPETTRSDPSPGETAVEVAVPTEDEQVCYHKGGDLRAEEVDLEMAVLPEVTQSTEYVTLEDIQVGDPTVNSDE